jgi:hypothetical protein
MKVRFSSRRSSHTRSTRSSEVAVQGRSHCRPPHGRESRLGGSAHSKCDGTISRRRTGGSYSDGTSICVASAAASTWDRVQFMGEYSPASQRGIMSS